MIRQHCRLNICEYWLSWTNTVSVQKIPINILILKRGPCLLRDPIYGQWERFSYKIRVYIYTVQIFISDAREKFKIFPSTSCSFWKCCETFGSRCFKIGKLILPSICFQAILSPLDRSCLSYEIFKSIESCKLNKTTYNSPHIIKWNDTPQL